jgi:hypothetical protein
MTAGLGGLVQSLAAARTAVVAATLTDARSNAAIQAKVNAVSVIARGGTFIHIVNGHLMAVMVDDDPDSSNNQPGIFGIEIEATTKVSVRNIWLKKIN